MRAVMPPAFGRAITPAPASCSDLKSWSDYVETIMQCRAQSPGFGLSEAKQAVEDGWRIGDPSGGRSDRISRVINGCTVGAWKSPKERLTVDLGQRQLNMSIDEAHELIDMIHRTIIQARNHK